MGKRSNFARISPNLPEKILCAKHYPYNFSVKIKHEDQKKVYWRCMYDRKEACSGGSLWNPLNRGGMDLSNTEQKYKKLLWNNSLQNESIYLIGWHFFGQTKSNSDIFHHSVSFKGVETSVSEFKDFARKFRTQICPDFQLIKTLGAAVHPQFPHH